MTNFCPFLLATFVLFASSCGTLPPPSGGASIHVRSSDLLLIQKEIRIVFMEAGFALTETEKKDLHFRKLGSRSDRIAWAIIGDPEPIYVRPVVGIDRSKDGANLRCTYSVTQGYGTFGERTINPNVGGAFYQRLLRKVKERVENRT